MRFQFVIVLITIFSNSYKQMLVRGKVQSIHVRECITPEASLRCQFLSVDGVTYVVPAIIFA